MSRAALGAVTAATLLVLVSGTGGAVAGAMVTGKQIKNGTVTGRDVKDGSLGTVDLAAEARSALTGPAGSPGVAGERGAPGPAGDPASVSAGLLVVRTPAPAATAVTDGSGAGTFADCPAGHVVVGGGGRWVPLMGTAGDSQLSTSQPAQAVRSGGAVTGHSSEATAGLDSWFVVGVNHSGAVARLEAYAVCVPAQP
jgi:hypothetical protein